MSNYSKATNFTSKDSLPTGNPSKIVKGAEIDTEFTAISSAIASKADINSPTFTGVPAAPTAALGTNTTQLASTAFVKAAIVDLALGTMSTQNANAVAITGGTVQGVTISSLAADLAVADGGTGASSFTANNILLGNGTSPLQTVAPGAAGNSLVSNGTTWVSAAGYVGHQGQLFTSSGTFTVPAGVTKVKVTVIGGGGGGGGGSSTSGLGSNGSTGGTSSFSTISQTGGTFGGPGGNSPTYGADGVRGTISGATFITSGIYTTGGVLYGSGGAGGVAGADGQGFAGHPGGTNALVGVAYLTGLTPGGTISVTVGAGGAGGSGSGSNPDGNINGSAGTSGAVLVEW